MRYPQMIQLVLVAALGIAPLAHAQSRPASAANAAAPAPATPAPKQTLPQETPWEYLVATYGKTVFGSPEKTLAYRALGVSATAQEATEIQRSLDVLGRFGWELVAIVGTIGGDQQIVMKRRYDKSRATNESLAILRGRELYLKDLIDIHERAQRMREESEAAVAAEKGRPRLVELDAKEAEERRNRLVAERLSRINDALTRAKWGVPAVASVSVLDGPERFNMVELKLDLTGLMLQNGNTYRASAVKSWLTTTALPVLREAASGFGGLISITATATITFDGKVYTVGEQRTHYNETQRRWD